MKNKIINIKKNLIKKNEFKKNEFKKKILKSIIQNLNTKPIVRGYALKKYSKIQLKSSISKQKNNICLMSGRIKGVLKLTGFSRHLMKKIGLNNNLQNIKIKSW